MILFPYLYVYNSHQKRIMKEEVEFIIKGYHKAELAQMYHPDMSVPSAMCKMRRWINRNAKLKRKLMEVQVSGQNHAYTPREVGVIVEFLGEP